MSSIRTAPLLFLVSICAALGTSVAKAQTIIDSADLLDYYNADSLSLSSSLSSWAPSSGTHQESATTTSSGKTAASNQVQNSAAAFNGHHYVAFGSAGGLATADNLGLNGGAANPMSIAAVYTTTNTPAIQAIAGLASGGPVAKTWFDLHDRTSNVTGDPYLAGEQNDLNSNGVTGSETPAQAVNVLTFALATYSPNSDGTTSTQTLYFAYGTSGQIFSVQNITMPTDNTSAQKLALGYDGSDATQGDLELGTVAVYNSALTSTQAIAEIQALQGYYAAPEPGTWSLILLGVLGLAVWNSRRVRI